jgi:hypothetical protein
VEHTFVLGYANGHLGYAPTADAYPQLAYEECLSPFASDWQEIYEAKALDIIRRLAPNGSWRVWRSKWHFTVFQPACYRWPPAT